MPGGSEHRSSKTVVGQFNQHALQLTRAGPSWVATAIRTGLLVAVLSLVLSAATLLGRITILGLSLVPSDQWDPVEAVPIVLIAPPVETLLLVLTYRLTRPHLGLTSFVVVTALLAALAHAPTRHGLPVSATVSFIIMSYQYASFREQLGPGRAFLGVTLTHATINGVVVVFLLAINLLA